jgi:hypothetical protein
MVTLEDIEHMFDESHYIHNGKEGTVVNLTNHSSSVNGQHYPCCCTRKVMKNKLRNKFVLTRKF